MNIRNGHGTSAARIAMLTAALVATTASFIAADEQDEQPARLEVKQVDDDGRVKMTIGAEPDSSVKLVPFPEDLEEAADEPARQTSAAKTGSTRARIRTSPARQRNAEVAADDAGATNEASASAPARRKSRNPSGSVQRLPAATLSPKSDFQPRFRTPDVHSSEVRQAQHLEPVDSDEASSGTSQGPEMDAATDSTGFAESGTPVETTAPAEEAAVESRAPAAETSATGKTLLEEAYAKSKDAASEADYTAIIDLCRQAAEAGLKQTHRDYARRLMSWAYNRRGEALAERQRDKEALADFELSARLNPKSWRALHNRGVSYAAAGRIDEAIADFDATIKLNPKYANAHFNRGELLYAQGRFQEAIRDYTTAIDLGPADAAMHNSRGHAYARLQQYGDALGEYGKALDLDPKYAVALVNRGDTYNDVGRYADAAADYRAAIDADPQMGRAYQAAAWLMATCPDEHYRNDQLATEAATKAIELEGENYRNLETLAAAQASIGKFDEAKRTQEKAIAMVPRQELVPAEKRMALYQRELAYRGVSPQQAVVARQERQQAAAEQKSKFPVQRASAEVPEGMENVTYPETQLLDPADDSRAPTTSPTRRLWPSINPWNHAQRSTRLPPPEAEQQQVPPQGRQATRPRTLPKRPTRPPQNIRPW